MIDGRILHIQRLSTEDGPGIRTTVFFKGCPLHCAWCHNPESISPRLQTHWFQVRCIGCQTCVKTCPNDGLTMSAAGLVIDRARCETNGSCAEVCLSAEACPTGALEGLGRTVSVEELLGELCKDRAFFEKSGGGVTLSGGEPTFQPGFAQALLHGLKEQGIATALDTCGLCSTHTLDRLLPYTDLVLFDLKLIDPALHRQFTGASNERILDALQHIQELIRSQVHPIQLWIRTPLIPGATALDENLISIGRFLAGQLDGAVARWELCAFNNLCRDQYTRLGLQWAYAATPLMTRLELEHCEQVARSSGFYPERILATGASRAGEPI